MSNSNKGSISFDNKFARPGAGLTIDSQARRYRAMIAAIEDFNIKFMLDIKCPVEKIVWDHTMRMMEHLDKSACLADDAKEQ